MNAPFVSSSFDAVTITVEAAVAVATAVLLMTVALYREKKFKKTTTTNFLKEWSLAPSIFNIKAISKHRRTGVCSLSSLDEIVFR